jgi:hypothetical protein
MLELLSGLPTIIGSPIRSRRSQGITMHPHPKRIVNVVIVCVSVCLAVLGIWLILSPRKPVPLADAELPPITDSPFQNTRPGVAYAGMQSCQKCHPDEHASYAQTAHSQSLAGVDLVQEPPLGIFEDSRSQRHYRIYRQAGKLRHEESIRTAQNETLVLADFPVKYAIGSGRFSRSYLVERDGFLFESPATWYAGRPGWSLSPGYAQFNLGFERPADLHCLSCHAGRIESVDRSPQRIAFHSLAIDCERCHGPGELHVKQREANALSLTETAERDTTIVNPVHLDRQRREDICAQCHLNTAGVVDLRGRSLQDFRPGQLLTDFVAYFGLEGPRTAMEVVGHIEQLRLSRCYQASESLTCITCHDPHAKPDAKAKLTHFRNTCLECHTENSCGQPRELRLKSNAADNCITCHMPRGPTEIPHFAFTHHRIGIHASKPNSEPKRAQNSTAGVLVPLQENRGLSELDRERNLGQAYLQLSDEPGQELYAAAHRKTALQILSKVQPRLSDIEVEASLARVNYGIDNHRTLLHARHVAESPDASPDSMAIACYTLGSTYYRLKLYTEAIPWLEQTLKLRPTADIWSRLSECREQTQELDRAVEAARQAREMAPDQPSYLRKYVQILQRAGKGTEASVLVNTINDLEQYQKRVGQPTGTSKSGG